MELHYAHDVVFFNLNGGAEQVRDSLVVKDVQLFLTGDGHYTAYARPDGCQWMEMNDGNAPKPAEFDVPRQKNSSVLFYSPIALLCLQVTTS